MQRIPSIYYGPSPVSGRGVFTYSDIPEGSILEICPVIVIPKEQFKQIHTSVLHDYYFLWGETEEQCAIALGYGSLYNHSHEPNAKYLVDYEEKYIQFIANGILKLERKFLLLTMEMKEISEVFGSKNRIKPNSTSPTISTQTSKLQLMFSRLI